jgi:4-azaleucine resistance transporter AzlC
MTSIASPQSTTLHQVLQLTTPVGMGYLPTGFAFGVLAIKAGLSPLLAIAMSIFIFAGALQFAAVTMLVTGAGISTVILTTLLINLRHVLYAIPLIEYLPKLHIARAYVIAALTDENYSVLTTVPEGGRQRLAPWISLVNHGYWIFGTVLGVLFGAHVARWIPNLGFALIGVGAYFLARMLFPGYVLIASLSIGLTLLLTLVLVQNHATSTRDAR